LLDRGKEGRFQATRHAGKIMTRALAHDPPGIDDQKSVAPSLDLVEPMRGDEHGPPLAAEPLEQVEQVAGSEDIQARCRLVEHQGGRVVDQR
jgi:hypothetical protein